MFCGRDAPPVLLSPPGGNHGDGVGVGDGAAVAGPHSTATTDDALHAPDRLMFKAPWQRPSSASKPAHCTTMGYSSAMGGAPREKPGHQAQPEP
jgi:hypothetical protein